MGFLDQLKQQASGLQRQHQDHKQLALRSVQLVEAAAREVRSYLMELAASVDVIRPAPPRRYTLDRTVVVESAPIVDMRFDARRKIVAGQEVIDHIVMIGSARSGRAVALRKDFINEIERLDARLAQAGIDVDREAVRNPANNKLIEMRYAFTADVQLSIHVTCDHAAGRLRFVLRNLDGLETVECNFDPAELGRARLDELARWWVGEPHRFVEGARDLLRREVR